MGTRQALITALEVPGDRRIYAIALALQRGFSVEKIHKHTDIDMWCAKLTL